MGIIILGKNACAKCGAAKKKLELLRRPFVFFAFDAPENWREVGAVEALAAAAHEHLDVKTELPVLVIDGQAHRYEAAMKILKAAQAGGE